MVFCCVTVAVQKFGCGGEWGLDCWFGRNFWESDSSLSLLSWREGTHDTVKTDISIFQDTVHCLPSIYNTVLRKKIKVNKRQKSICYIKFSSMSEV